MADLDVQPKKSNPWWLWLLLAIIAMALLFFFLRNRKEDNSDKNNASSTMMDSTTVSGSDSSTTDDWGAVDFNASEATYDEVNDKDINVKGNDRYAIYSVDETVLFGSDQSSISTAGEEKLKTIAGSVGKRFSGGEVRVYGHTDSEGSAGYNKDLAEKRTESVKSWLVGNGNITTEQISLHPVGEAQPVASNSTEAGKQQNRRVEIVARAK